MSRIKSPRRAAAEARNRLLPEGRAGGPMPWVVAIMMFLTVLTAAASIGLGSGLLRLHNELAGRFTVQLVEPNQEQRDRLVRSIAASLRSLPEVENVNIVPEARLAEQLRPWLGDAAEGNDIPIPALVDVTVRPYAQADVTGRMQGAVAAVSPQARIEAHATYLEPVEKLMRSLMALAIVVTILMMIATAAVVGLAARGAHAANRGTIDILHLMGATDIQIARLFQRRAALDALFGGVLGWIAAIGALLLLGRAVVHTASELASLGHLPLWGWLALPAFPLGGVVIAMIIARWTVRRALERSL